MSYREGSEGEAICPHRDTTVCPACAASDERLVEVYGVWFFVPDGAERAELERELRGVSDVERG